MNMEINKQLFEDVLSGKLKGTFVLRNGETYYSDVLRRNYGGLKFTHPYVVWFKSYTPKGIFAMYDRGAFDIVNFTPDADMKENELTIEIPDGKIVDWDESKKQNKIVLKDKQLTYDDVCKKLFSEHYCFIESDGSVEHIFGFNGPTTMDKNNATTEHQLECILAKNMLANVAKYLNGEWKPYKTDLGHFDAWVLFATPDKDFVGYTKITDCAYNSNVLFRSPELAKQAVKILGEETVKLALEPLGI